MTNLPKAAVYKTFIISLVLFASTSYANEFTNSDKNQEPTWITDWEENEVKRDIHSSCRQHKTKIKQCKFRTISKVPMEALSAVIMDVDKFTEWAVSVSRSERVFKDEDPEKLYVYTNYDFVGAYDRDAVSLYTPEYDEDAKRLRITFQTVDKDVPKEDLRLVRFPLMAGYWQFTALPNGTTEIEHLSFTLPGGVVQSNLYYLYNLSYVDASYDTIEALQAQAGKAQYSQKTLAALLD